MMRLSTLLILGFGLSWTGTASARPYNGATAYPAAVAAFDAAALSDSELSEQTAMALPAKQRYRALADQYSEGFLQQVGEDSRIALDNWWAQTGASLIVNNVLPR